MTDQRPTLVADEPTTDELDEELLPGGPEPELPADADPTTAAEDQHALAVLDSVTPTVPGDAWVEPEQADGKAEPEKPRRKRSRRLPPANIGESVLDIPVHLRLISMGKGIANITATLVFDLDHSVDGISDLMGEHAYSAVFRSDYLGDGIILKEAPLKVDAENLVKQGLKVTLPRFGAGADQLTAYVVPLLPEDVDLTTLFGMSLSWRLNIPVDFPGLLSLHPQQASFDLTKKSGGDTQTTYEPTE